MRRIIIIMLLMVTLLSGCYMTMDRKFRSRREQMLNQGQSVEYIDGYDAGYVSGQWADNYTYCHFKLNPHRYDSDSQYKQGWDDGYRDGKDKPVW